MPQILAVVNQKGGVAKTTTCLSLGACLVEAGYPTLLIDLDPQANLTISSGVGEESDALTISDLVSAGCQGLSAPIEQAIIPTRYTGLDMISADASLAVLERDLYQTAGYESLLGTILDSVREKYAYILMDCSPSLGALTIMALTASQNVIVPLQCEYLAAWGVLRLVETIDAVREHTNESLGYSLLVTMYDQRNSISREVNARLREKFCEQMLETVIGVDTRLKESVVHGEPIIVYAPKTRASQQYRQLAQEILVKFSAGVTL